jgi:hypothetical protein
MSMRMRRRVVATAVTAGLVVGVMMASGPALALGSSTFEGADGNKTVDTTQDWASTNSALTLKTDTTTGPTDESFTQGTKSDTLVPTIDTGSIPPNKSDLTEMWVHSEIIDGSVYLHVAWSRTNTLGSANMNFEFNKGTDGLNSNGPTAAQSTPKRLPGDFLITFDFSSGANQVDLGLATWGGDPCVASGARTPNCWGDFQDLDAATIAEGEVSADLKFGEATIDLTAAGIFDSTGCNAFGYAYLTSRSSDAFSAALKDYVPPKNISLSNCGAFKIIKTAKHFDTSGDTAADLRATFEIKKDGVLYKEVTTPASGELCVTAVPAGTYTVKEKSGASGYRIDPDTESVTVSLSSTCANLSRTFVNDPLSKLTLDFDSLVPGGTAASIDCVAGTDPTAVNLTPTTADSTPTAYDDDTEVYDNLLEGTYTCTIVVDP